MAGKKQEPKKEKVDRRSENRKEAERLYLENNGTLGPAQIAEKLILPASKIRKWKMLDDWDKSLRRKKRLELEERRAKGLAKPGAPKGSQNAKGNPGNKNPSHKLEPRTKHGAYTPVFMDLLTDEEKEVVNQVSAEEENLYLEQIKLFAVREHRIMKAINKYLLDSGDLAIYDLTRRETIREFKDEEEARLYQEIEQERIAEGKKLPGKPVEVETRKNNKDMVVARLEQELSTVQNKKTKAIESLAKLRLDKMKLENEARGDAAVEDWIMSIMNVQEMEDEQ